MKSFKDFTNSVDDIGAYKRVSGRLGSNPAGVYEKNGEQFYIKHSHSNDHAHNEVLASKLYKLAGSPVIDQNLIHTGAGKLGTISKMEKLTTFNPHNKSHLSAIQDHIATHAWTSNWDTVGLENDNQAHDTNGNMKTVDVGGALRYRAQGGPKGEAFGDHPTEMKTFKDSRINPEAAHVFGNISPETERNSIQRIKAIPDESIRDTVKQYSTPEHADTLTKTLIARKNNL